MKSWRITYKHEHVRGDLLRITKGSLAVTAPDMAGAYREASKHLGSIKRLRIVACEELK